MGFIYFLSDTPASEIELATGPIASISGMDILAHLTLYSILSALVLRTLIMMRISWIKNGFKAYITFFFATCYGTLDEVHQSNVSGRSSEFNDVIVDALGALLILLLWYIYKARKRNRHL